MLLLVLISAEDIALGMCSLTKLENNNSCTGLLIIIFVLVLKAHPLPNPATTAGLLVFPNLVSTPTSKAKKSTQRSPQY